MLYFFASFRLYSVRRQSLTLFGPGRGPNRQYKHHKRSYDSLEVGLPGPLMHSLTINFR